METPIPFYHMENPTHVLSTVFFIFSSRAQLQLAVKNLEQEEKQHDEKHHLYRSDSKQNHQNHQHSESPQANKSEHMMFSGPGNA